MDIHGCAARGVATLIILCASAAATAIYKDCNEARAYNPDAPDGWFQLKPDLSSDELDPGEKKDIPADGVRAWCRFEGVHAWALVGTFQNQGGQDPKWAKTIWDFTESPDPDDTNTGKTARFPLGFWNDLMSGLPDGALTYSSSKFSTDDPSMTNCPAFWKTTCRMKDVDTAHTPECGESYQTYNDGAFHTRQFVQNDRKGFTDAHGSVIGFATGGFQKEDPSGPRLVLTMFQSGFPAMGKCRTETLQYITYQHSVGFTVWIGGRIPVIPTTSTQVMFAGATVSSSVLSVALTGVLFLACIDAFTQ